MDPHKNANNFLLHQITQAFSIYNIFHFATQICSQLLDTTINRNTKTTWRKRTTCTEILTISLLIGILCPVLLVIAVDPKFDISTRMRLVLIPADAQVGSVIYRLRATDEEFDYPLTFEFVGDASSSTVKIESLPCTKYNSVCQANVILTRRLEPGRYYDFQVSVKDTKGGMTTQLCSITATNFTTPHDLIFPHKPGIIMIPEDAKRGTELDYVIARKNPLFQKPVYLELWGSPLFAIRQKIVSNEATEGTVFLLGPLDFEKQAMYHLTILANDAYAEPGQDSRNIAGMEIVLIVQDVQDQPPVFTLAPPVTKLPTGLLPGDKILQVHAEDGDKGNPREVRYGLVSEGNPFTSFFDINDTSGEIFLMRPLEDIAAIIHIGDPVLLTVIAEEVKVGRDEPPAMASTVQLAFFLPERTNTAPYFENDHYVSRVDENAPQGTALTFIDPYVPRVYDDDVGKNGVFSLTLLNNNGTFEISPNVAERSASFLIRVRDNLMLDYEERHSVQFQVLAQELGPATNLSAIVNITVYINDVNDNPPIFNQPVYTVELPENMTIGTKVVQVHADDVDTGAGGSVRYTAILGYLNTSLNLDADTGIITVSTNNHGFDREVMPEYHLYVEARDNDGTGNRAQVPLVIKLIDVNDETPKFEKDLYEFILALDLQSFTSPAFIHAIDKDATAPNNEVRYEIINGNYDNKFNLDKVTGELTVVEKIVFRKRRDSHIMNRSRRQLGMTSSESGTAKNIFLLTARAYDLGVPVRFSTTTIRIYPPESRTRTVTFLVPGLQPNKAKTEETLSTITGGRVVIHEIRPLRPDEAAENPTLANNKSVVTATVLYDSSSVVDIYQIQQRLSQHNSSFAIMTHDMTETDNLTPLQTLYKAENKLLFWLLILLATLVGLTILILLLCCICSWCPLYGAASKRIVNINRTEDDVHLVHREMANGKQAKSVQVAEWAGRREAWSAEKPSDPRTKPTRWEFRDGRGTHTENIEHPMPFQEETEEIDDRRHALAEERLSRVRIKNSHTAKEDNHNSFHNSRTNLINEKDVYIEDVNDDVEIIDDAHRYHNKIRRRQQQPAHHDRQQHKNIYADNNVNNIDDDSMRRHEIDRGSDIDYNTGRSSLKNKREFFIKDGNIEILQLVTRDKTHDMSAIDDENIYVNVPPKSNLSQPHLLMIDNSGKEILMRRFIEEQPDGKQIIREHYQIVPGATYIQSMPNEIQQNSTIKGDTFPLGKSEPNSIIYSQNEPEVKIIHTQPAQNAIITNTDTKDPMVLNSVLQPSISNQSLTQELETSLKQQNALLRQILLEKEKFETRYVSQQEIAMETQSLPGQSMAIATQTDCEAATQTDAEEMHGTQRSGSTNRTVTLRRKARSENDDSLSEDEYEYIPFSPPNNPEGIYFIKRKRQKKRIRRNGTQPRKRIIMVEEVKRKIRTPITEEGEEFYEYRKRPSPKKPLRYHGETKASILRRKKNEANKLNNASPARNVQLKGHDVLIQISDSMDEKIHYSADKSNHIKKNISNKSHINRNEEEYYDTDEDIDNYERRTEYSVDSDTDEIVIKSDGFGNASHSGTHHRFEIHLGEDQNANTLPMSEQQPHSAYESVTNFSRGVTYRRSNSLNGSHHGSQDESKHSITINNMSTKEAATETRNSKKRKKNYKSETDLLEGTDKTIPKYMEWYYGSNKKQQPAIRTVAEAVTTKVQAPTKRNSEQTAEKRITKTRINTKSDTAVTITNSKPEPAPRKTPPKGNRMLKEDMALSKQVKNKIGTDANHPLVQHSEHRFERENATEVPAPPTKLPHYMYPETPPFAGSSKVHVSQRQKPKPSPIKENEMKISKSKINVYIEDPKAASRTHSTSSIHAVQKQLNVSTLEDDHDSGIAMNSLLNSMGRRNPIADKKSVFSIAYDNVSQVKKIPSDGESPKYS